MDVTPQLLNDVEFREAKRGGYNTQDVDEFLERLAVGLERQETTLREARQRVEDAEARAAEALERASETSDTDDTLKRTLVLAQRTADAAIKEADEMAAQTIAAAQDQASRLLADAQESTARARAEADAEARRAHEDSRTRVLAELRALEVSRDQLRGDVDVLERHLSEQRDRLRLTTRELQRLLDDPEALREVSLPVMSDAPPPAAAHTAPSLIDALVTPKPSMAAEAPAVVEDAPVATVDELDFEASDLGATPPPSAAYADLDADLSPEGDPPTQTIDLLAERGVAEDDYLTELRKAMTDDSPLGPREDGDVSDLFSQDTEPQRSRFGRRR